jgi:geranylgeranyl pyrophosphate synthase
MKLSEGQGAELVWRDSRDKRLSPAEAIQIYALKTSPAFEAALLTGARLAGPLGAYRSALPEFARHLGVAFQILNDLGDWRGDSHNKLTAAGDVLGGRPTVLWALALEGRVEEDRAELESLVARQPLDGATLRRVRELYEQSGVFSKAMRLVEKHRRQAEIIAAKIEPPPLRALLYYLIESVLKSTSDWPT